MVEAMNLKKFNVKEAKEKIRSLRNTYLREIVEISKSKSSRSGLEDVYIPTLRRFSTMDRILGTVLKSRENQAIGIPEDVNKGPDFKNQLFASDSAR
ncbi:unnamed protein product [Acanthoscelides obtectus]|uniref:Uncharacterized protein n=1 Tax=Acanthoscelides obtectus TaxID=200917 RepID=A0A9P0KST1_ACAOB|nr:unnamed protein product [Acanthoscelides obtectus]CAK1653966.1 hypothetical protein AOBTE_LOCUS18408 [Acanthoscelides obtectus]